MENFQEVYESYINGQKKQFMEQIDELKIDITLFIGYVKNYHNPTSALKVATSYAALAQNKLEDLQYLVEKR